MTERRQLTYFVVALASATGIAFAGLRSDSVLNRGVAVVGAIVIVALAAWRLWRPRQTRAVR